MTGTTAVLGWWGTISLIVTPFFLLNNIGRYLFCLGMAPVPPGASVPTLSEDSVQRITPVASQLFDRLGRGEAFDRVIQQTAAQAGVAPAQVILFVRAVIEAQQQQKS